MQKDPQLQKDLPARIDYSRKFDKLLKKSPLEIKIAFRDRFELFLEDPFHPLLNNHALTGDYSGFRSINVTGNWRAIFSEHFDDKGQKVIIFEFIGTHPQLYNRFDKSCPLRRG